MWSVNYQQYRPIPVSGTYLSSWHPGGDEDDPGMRVGRVTPPCCRSTRRIVRRSPGERVSSSRTSSENSKIIVFFKFRSSSLFRLNCDYPVVSGGVNLSTRKNHCLIPSHWWLSHMPQLGWQPGQWWETASSQWQRFYHQQHSGIR